LPFEKSTVM
nr:Chain C, NP418 epitope from 1980 influenza strain [synthetic construct]